MNDGIYAAIGHIQDTFQDGRRFFGELRGPDLGWAWRALAGNAGPGGSSRPGPIRTRQWPQAIAVAGPALVEVDMRTRSARRRPTASTRGRQHE